MDVCAICQDPLASQATVRLDCKHELHAQCAVNWLQRSPTCPLCRHRPRASGDDDGDDDEGRREVLRRAERSDDARVRDALAAYRAADRTARSAQDATSVHYSRLLQPLFRAHRRECDRLRDELRSAHPSRFKRHVELRICERQTRRARRESLAALRVALG